MRLIDADVFKTEYENLITWVSHRAEKARLREFIKDIQNQPTVKAIPKEWIEKYAKRFIDLENRNYFAYRGFSDTGKAILYMLEEWEKENEHKESD